MASCCIILLVYFNSCVTEVVLLAVELLADEFYEPTIMSFTLFLVTYSVGILVLCPYLTGYGIPRLRTRQRRSGTVATLF